MWRRKKKTKQWRMMELVEERAGISLLTLVIPLLLNHGNECVTCMAFENYSKPHLHKRMRREGEGTWINGGLTQTWSWNNLCVAGLYSLRHGIKNPRYNFINLKFVRICKWCTVLWFAVPCKRIHTPWLFSHLVTLHQPNTIDAFFNFSFKWQTNTNA